MRQERQPASVAGKHSNLRRRRLGPGRTSSSGPTALSTTSTSTEERSSASSTLGPRRAGRLSAQPWTIRRNNAHGVAIADLNGDGKPDLAVANAGAQQHQHPARNGDGTFGAATQLPSRHRRQRASRPADFNGDGNVDLVYGEPGLEHRQRPARKRSRRFILGGTYSGLLRDARGRRGDSTATPARPRGRAAGAGQ